jgi:hypothetical protein
MFLSCSIESWFDETRERDSNRTSNDLSMLGFPQIVGDFELRAFTPQPAIADVQGVTPRILMAVGDDIEPCYRQFLRQVFR